MKTMINTFGSSLKRMMNKTAALTLLALLTFGFARASENGELKVTVLDEDGGPAVGALVTLLTGDQVLERKNADANGIAFFKEVIPGKYDVRVEMFSMNTHTEKGIDVSAGKPSYVSIKLTVQKTDLPEFVVHDYKRSMTQETMSSGQDIPLDMIKTLPAPPGNIVSIVVAVTPGVLPTNDGKDIYSRGSRSGSNEYVIDGEKVIGGFNIPSQSIQGMTVYTGGVPACYGDFTGGLIMITTKSFFNGVQEKKNMYKQIGEDLQDEQEYQDELKNQKKEEGK